MEGKIKHAWLRKDFNQMDEPDTAHRYAMIAKLYNSVDGKGQYDYITMITKTKDEDISRWNGNRDILDSHYYLGEVRYGASILPVNQVGGIGPSGDIRMNTGLFTINISLPTNL